MEKGSGASTGSQIKTLTMKDTDLMPFGKYEGVEMANVPASYLMHAHENFQANSSNFKVLKYIQDNLDAIKLELEREKREKQRKY